MKKLLLAAAVTALFGIAHAQEPVDTQIVVIGAGGAGLASAIEATNIGAKVIVVEKNGYIGGNTIRATGGLNAAETAVQKSKGTKDSKEIMYYDTMKGGHWLNNPELVRTLVDNADKSVEWLLALGGDFRDVGLMGGASQPRTHRPTGGAAVGPEVIRTLKAAAEERHIDIRLRTKAVEILKDKSGKIDGIKVVQTVRKDGKNIESTYIIHAKAVIDAAGGFGANNAMVAKYQPQLKGYITTNQAGATGDGILLAEKDGAATVDMKQIQIHPTVVPGEAVLITEAMRGNGAILVNHDGKRFFDELQTRDAVSAAILKQPKHEAYLVFDSEMQKSLKASNKYITRPYCTTAPSIAELAKKLKMDPKVLEKTMADYKAGRTSGKDAFGRANMKFPLDKGPFYAIIVAPAVHHTMGGLRINKYAQVLNNEGQPIPGLYAAGEVTGGVHGANRLGGNAQADIITFGRIAGQQATEYVDGHPNGKM